MWETTFPRNSHAGLGEDYTHMYAYSRVCQVRKLAYPIRRGYFSEMLFPTWTSCRRLVYVRYSVLCFLAKKITRCISHISPDAVRLVDVRDSVLYFLARNITRCISHISIQLALKSFVSGRVKERRTMQCTDIFHSVGLCQSCATHPHLLDNLHFAHFDKCQPAFVVDAFVKMCEMEIVQQMGRSGTRLVYVRYSVLYLLARKSQDAYRTSRALWRAKKSHFQPSDESAYENVDKIL